MATNAVDYDALAKQFGGVDVDQQIQDSAQRHGVDPGLVHSVVKAESGGNPNATSPKGAGGLMQLMPSTADSLGVTDVYDPKQNIEAGVKHLKRLQDKYKDDRRALAAYNAGEDAVDTHNGVPPYKETQDYVNKILGPEVDYAALAKKFGGEVEDNSGDLDSLVKKFGGEYVTPEPTIPGYGPIPGVPRPKVPGLDAAAPAAPSTPAEKQPTGINPELTMGTGFTPADFAGSPAIEQQNQAYDSFLARWGIPQFPKDQTEQERENAAAEFDERPAKNIPPTQSQIKATYGMEGVGGSGLSAEQMTGLAKEAAKQPAALNNLYATVGDAALKLVNPENIAIALTAEFGAAEIKAAANSQKVIRLLETLPGGETLKKGIDLASRSVIPAVFGTQAAHQAVESAKAGEPVDAIVNGLLAAASLLGIHETAKGTFEAYPTPKERATTPGGEAAETAKAYAAAGENLKASEWAKAVKVDVGDYKDSPAYVQFTGVKNGQPHFDLIDKESGEIHTSGTYDEIHDLLQGKPAAPAAEVAPGAPPKVSAGEPPPPSAPTPAPATPSGEDIQPGAIFETPKGKFTVKGFAAGKVVFEKETASGKVIRGNLPESVFRKVVGTVPTAQPTAPEVESNVGQVAPQVPQEPTPPAGAAGVSALPGPAIAPATAPPEAIPPTIKPVIPSLNETVKGTEDMPLVTEIVKPGTEMPSEKPGAKQKVTLYRGVRSDGEDNTVGVGRFYSEDRKIAEQYAGDGGKVQEHEVTFNNLLTADNWQQAKEALGLPRSTTMPELIDAAKKAGHDGITFKSSTNGQEYIHIPPQNVTEESDQRLAEAAKVRAEKGPTNFTPKPIEEPAANKPEAAAEPERKYSSTQVNMPEEIAKSVRDFGLKIPEAKLAEEGREKEPHTTVLYGIHAAEPADTRTAIEGHGPITVKIGKLSVFKTKDADVLKFDVESPDLHALNAKVASAVEHTNTHPKYIPHITVAYLKPGEGKQYAGRPIPGVTGKTVTFDKVIFSPHEGEKSEIDLSNVGQPEGVGVASVPIPVASAPQEIPVAPPAETPTMEVSHEPDASAGENPPALAEVSPANVPGTPDQGVPGAESPERGPTDEGSLRPGDREGAGAGPGEGTDQGAMGVPAGGERSPGPRGASEPRAGTGVDYRIAPEDQIGAGTIKQKANDNLSAIRTLKAIEAEGRQATPSEQKILVKYTGWGGMPQPFMEDWRIPREWTGVREELNGLLTKEEFELARGSTPNAHYTSPMVVGGMWDAVKRLGLLPEGGQVSLIEPSMGTGNFFGLMPEGTEAQRVGVELDSITGRIAKLLYPNADIHVTGFEKVRLPNDYFDLAISNVPFGNYGVFDPQFKRTPALTKSIHDYFFAKALEKVRSGGVVAFITSNFTLDKKDPYIRKYLAGKADLLGAIRLPNTAFKGNAGTEVTTDIIFLQKRAPQAEAAGEPWTETQEIQTPDGAVEVNEYYAKHPEMMLGQMGLQGTMYAGRSAALIGDLTPEKLAEAVNRLPENVVRAWQAPQQSFDSVSSVPNAGELKDGAYGLKDGKIVIRQGDQLRPANIGSEQTVRVRGMIGIRDALHEVFRTQREADTEEKVQAAMKRLNDVYDKFTKVNGALHLQKNAKAFAGDPDDQTLLALENWDNETKKATKSDIFTQRVIDTIKPAESADNAKDALGLSLNEKGRIDWVRMQELTGRTPAEMQQELGDIVFQNPAGKMWEPADEYLSGNVRRKLADAEAAAKMDPKFQKNVDALKTVQPKDLVPGEIKGRLGASWIPKEDIRDFVSQLLEIPRNLVTVGHSDALASWTLDIARNKDTVANSKTYGTARYYGSDLILDAMNLRNPTVYDMVGSGADRKQVINEPETLAAREMQRQIKERFSEWVWEDHARAERLAQTYNTELNSERLWQPDGSHMTFPGMALTLKLRPHQKNGVWRIVRGDGNVLLAHVVGSGKTLEIVAGAMELRRLGRARKPMVVVPKNRVEGTAEEWLRAYPSANILTVGGEDFTPDIRKQTMARIATGNWDGVIVAYEPFGKLPVSDETFNGYIQEQIDELVDYLYQAKGEKADARIVKELEKSKKRLEAKLRTKAKTETKDRGIGFEDLGVDAMFVDEADSFKNLQFPTKMTRISGIPNTESDRAFDMYIKTQYIAKRNNGRGIVFATGTPVANSMAEVWTMQRYLQPKYLKDHGLQHFDAWAQTFGEVNPALEMSPDGSGVRITNKFNKFVNAPELMTGFRQMADVQTAKMLNLPVPKVIGGRPRIMSAKASPEQMVYLKKLAERAKKVKGKKPQKGADNILVIGTDGQKAAIDMRLIDPSLPDNPNSKVNLAVNDIVKIWQETAEKRSTQLVFLDLSTPKKKGEGFSVYNDMRDKLIARGIPPNEIAFIQDYKKDGPKEQLFSDVNKGRVRIVFGSTGAMGVGVNVQKKLIAEHQLDAPYRPRDVEQREGRMIRQGNENPEVHIVRYVTEPSFDARKWDILQGKAAYIDAFMEGNMSLREIEDISDAELSYGEIAAIASGNPAIREKVVVDTEIRKLDAMKSRYEQQQFAAKRDMQSIPDQIRISKDMVVRAEADIATREANKPEFTIGKETFTGEDARKRAGEALHKVLESLKNNPQLNRVNQNHGPITIGSYRGFRLDAATGVAFGGQEMAVPDVNVVGRLTYNASTNQYGEASGTLQSIESRIRNIEGIRDAQQGDVEKYEKKLMDTRELAERKFEQGDKLRDLLTRQAELAKQLQTTGPDPSAVAGGDDVTATDDEANDHPEDLEDLQAIKVGSKTKVGIPTVHDSERGAAPILTDLAETIASAVATKFRDDVNYSGMGALKNVFVRNLSQLSKASPASDAAALQLASYRARAATILHAAVGPMNKALKGSGVSLDEVFAALIQDRLNAIRERYEDLGNQALEASDEDLPKVYTDTLADLLDAIEGRKDLPSDLTQIAGALVENEAWDDLRTFLSDTFNHAASRVATMLEPEWFDALVAVPQVREAVRIYRAGPEPAMAEAHRVHEGIFSTAIGKEFGAYYPLTPVEIPSKRGSGRTLPYHKPRNMNNVFATGLSDEYDPGRGALRKRLENSIHGSDKFQFLKVLEEEGWLVPAKIGQTTFIQPTDGREVPGSRVEMATRKMILKPGEKPINVPARMGIMPKWLRDEVDPLLEGKDFGTPANFVTKVINAINTVAVAGIAEPIFHGRNILGGVIQATPFIGKALAQKGMGAFLKDWDGAIEALNLHPSEEEMAQDFIEMAKYGIVPDRFGAVSYSKAAAEQMGGKQKLFGLSPLLFGTNGLDINARWLLYRVQKQLNPGATPREINDFVNLLGNYTYGLQSKAERLLKSIGLSPFITAGNAGIRRGIKTWTGMGQNPSSDFKDRLLHQLFVGGVAGLILWAIIHKHVTGQYPDKKKDSEIGYITMPNEYRHSNIGNVIFGKGSDKVKVNVMFWNPDFGRGARALGLARGYRTKMLGGNSEQIAEGAFTDMLDSWSQPLMGPVPRVGMAAGLGSESYLTGLRDQGGRPAPQFFPALPKKTSVFPMQIPGTKFGTKLRGVPANAAWRASASVKEMNSFYHAIGQSTGLFPQNADETNDTFRRTMVNLAFPGAFKRASDSNAAADRLQRQRQAMK